MSYSNKVISDYIAKHPKGYTQLLHMVVANYLSYINQSVYTQVSNSDLENVSNDIGLAIDNYLESRGKSIRLPDSYLSTFSKDTYGNHVAALFYQHAQYVNNLNNAIRENQNYSNILQNMNNKDLFVILQSAGDNPIMIDKSIKMWRRYLDDLLKHIQNKDRAGVVQLYSFDIANHMIRLLS